MRTTLDISEREHALFTALARERRTSFSKLVVELALRGLKNTGVGDAPAGYRIDPETGLPLFRSGQPLSGDDIKALEDEELGRHGPFA
jgi:hypothetical protein